MASWQDVELKGIEPSKDHSVKVTEEQGMKAICSHEFTRTSYCPHCGEKIAGHGLDSLMRHCQTQVDQAKIRLKVAEKRNYPREIEQVQARLKKWSAWTACLRDAINADTTRGEAAKVLHDINMKSL